jgi:hypothetical protein
MSDEEERLTRKFQVAHNAVCDFDFAEPGKTDFERTAEYLRLIAVKREVRSRVDAYKRAQRFVGMAPLEGRYAPD